MASVRLVHPRVVLPASRLIRPGGRPEFRARLSPDGKHILFPHEVKGQDATYRLLLQDIEPGRETEIPIDLPRGYETVFTRFNFFNPAGDKLALCSLKQYPNPTVTEVVIYNIPSNKLTATNITGNAAMAQFDRTGKRLLVSQHNSYIAMASLDDYSIGKPLESGWVHSCSPYSPYATVFQPPDPLRRRIGFKLFNLELQTALELPVHEKNRALDDVTDQWSSDGKYLFYMDVHPSDGGGQSLVPFPVTQFRDLSQVLSRSSWLPNSTSPNPKSPGDVRRSANAGSFPLLPVALRGCGNRYWSTRTFSRP
jgi:hypothetical protein